MVLGTFRVAEEKPVAPGVAARLAFLQKGDERRDTGTGADHDRRVIGIDVHAKLVGTLDIDRHLTVTRQALGQER